MMLLALLSLTMLCGAQEETMVEFENRFNQRVAVQWVGGDNRVPMGEIGPLGRLALRSFVGHRFETFLGNQPIGEFVVAVVPQQTFVVRANGAARALRHENQSCDALEHSVGGALFANVKCDPTPDEAAAIRRARKIHEGYEVGRMSNEQRRLLLNREQPKLVPTFTKVGYEKHSLPEDLWKKVRNFWQANKDRSVAEAWDKGNSYVNHWEIQPTMAHLPQWLKDESFRVLQPLLEKWSGQELEPTACYGIRLYHRGSVLANHVDRIDTHAISAIINVDQVVDEPWALEIHNHTDFVDHVFMEPRDMLFYESASRIHGRPTPFKGKYFANYFIHFRPKHNWKQFDI